MSTDTPRDAGWQLSAEEVCADLAELAASLTPEHDGYPVLLHAIERLSALSANRACVPAGHSPGDELCPDEVEIVESARLKAIALIDSVTARLCIHYRQVFASAVPAPAGERVGVPIDVLRACLFALDAAREYPDFDNAEGPLTILLDKAMQGLKPFVNAARPVAQPTAEPPRCPKCGYTYEDCQRHLDHSLCGEPAPPKPTAEPVAQPSDAQARDGRGKEIERFSTKYLGEGRAHFDGKQMLRAWITRHGTGQQGLQQGAQICRNMDGYSAMTCADEIEREIAALSNPDEG